MHLFNLDFWIDKDGPGKVTTVVYNPPLITVVDTSNHALSCVQIHSNWDGGLRICHQLTSHILSHCGAWLDDS
jgi:hypothetical protein